MSATRLGNLAGPQPRARAGRPLRPSCRSRPARPCGRSRPLLRPLRATTFTTRSTDPARGSLKWDHPSGGKGAGGRGSLAGVGWGGRRRTRGRCWTCRGATRPTRRRAVGRDKGKGGWWRNLKGRQEAMRAGSRGGCRRGRGGSEGKEGRGEGSGGELCNATRDLFGRSGVGPRAGGRAVVRARGRLRRAEVVVGRAERSRPQSTPNLDIAILPGLRLV